MTPVATIAAATGYLAATFSSRMVNRARFTSTTEASVRGEEMTCTSAERSPRMPPKRGPVRMLEVLIVLSRSQVLE